VLVVEHERETTLDRMSGISGHSDCVVEVVRPGEGQPLPESPRRDGWDGVLVLGGEMAAWEDDVAPWLPAVRVLLRQSVEERVPTLGICLGAQLLAMAAGGHVCRGATGPEVGVLHVELAAAARDDPFLRRLPAVILAPQGHSDVVVELPPGAVALGSSARYPHQVFRLGPLAWGIQYHPEVSRAVLATWLEGHRGDLAARGSTPEHELEVFDRSDDDLFASAALHARAFADVVRDAAAARANGGWAAQHPPYPARHLPASGDVVEAGPA